MQFKILSWNIWYDGYFEEISKFLKEFDADIIGLQEVVPNDPTRDTIGFLTALGYQQVVAPVLKLQDGRTMANAIFSKHEILSNQTYVLSEVESRNALRSDIKVAYKTLHVFSTHLLHTHQQPSQIQELQANSLIKVLPSTHSIVMGDFNATPDSQAIKKMSDVLVNTDPLSTPTWSVYPEGCLVCNPQAVDTRLDYIFITRDIKATSFKVEKSKGSDHLPISVKVDI